jgi:hypothetical protein
MLIQPKSDEWTILGITPDVFAKGTRIAVEQCMVSGLLNDRPIRDGIMLFVGEMNNLLHNVVQ